MLEEQQNRFLSSAFSVSVEETRKQLSLGRSSSAPPSSRSRQRIAELRLTAGEYDL